MKIIARDEKLYETIVTTFPYFVAHEYKRFYNLLDEGRYIGAFFEMKDVLEVLLKFPALIGTAYAVRLHEQDGNVKDCLPILLEKQLSLGEWQVYAGKVRKILEVDEAVRPLRNILRDIKRHYDRQGIVKWRNTMIGHGAVANDTALYMADFEKYGKIINEHLQTCMEDYQALKIFVGDDALTGASPLLKPESLNRTVLAALGNRTFEISPFIFTKGEYIYFFDGMNRWHLVVDGLDYVNGRKIVFQSDYFLKKYRELESNGSLRPEAKRIGNVLTAEQNKFLNELNASRNFVPMDNLYQWSLDCLNRYDSGVFLLQMERAMGKTAFVSSMDQLIYGDGRDEELDDTVIRCYYCSRMEYRSTSDFINTCNTALFNKNKNAGLNIEASEYTWHYLTLDSRDPAGQMCRYLEDFRNIYAESFGKSKICLFIDGLDEITPDDLLSSGCSILDYIPDARRLPESVYIFLTCRTGEDEPLSDWIAEWLETYKPTAVKRVGRTETEQRHNLERFLKEHLTAEDLPEETEMDVLLGRAQGSYTQLQLFLALMHMGIKLKDVFAFDDISVMNHFLAGIENRFNEKMFRFAENILAVIAAAYEPLSLEQIAYLNGYSDIPLDMLAVIREINYILDFKRTPEGTKLRLANEVFRNQLYERYRDRISRQVDGWLDMLRMTGQGKIDEMNSADMAYLYNEGAIYLYANILNYAERTGNMAVLEKIYTKEMADIIYQFETHLDAKNYGYRGVLKDIEMSSSVIRIYERLMENGKEIDRLTYAKAYNNRGYHRGFTLTDYFGGEADYTKACEILDSIRQQDQAVLVAMGRIMNGMASVKLRCGRSFDEVQSWRQRSIEARRQRMAMDFAESVEEYMASLLENAQTLREHRKYDMICNYYEEMKALCERIKREYPDSYEKGMLYPRGKNRVEYGYVCQMAKMRTHYAYCLLETREIHDIYDIVVKLYEQSIKDYDKMIQYTGGVQVAVQGLLYKTECTLGQLYMRKGETEKGEAIWKKAFRIIRLLSMDNKLYGSATLQQFLKDFRGYLLEHEPDSDYLVQMKKLRIQT